MVRAGGASNPLPGFLAALKMHSSKSTSLKSISAARGGPIRWLILGGSLLIAAIAVGATLMAGNFRERTLHNAERELENSVQLLVHHFDQQLADIEVVQRDLIDYISVNGIMTADSYRRQLSTEAMHRMLTSKMSALS